ncbi:MAG: DUF1830 domain-containing protein [Cyanobacteria bacterium M_surface_7_m2_040]|nr:DUF1830 domain-containing protein [Cyanobacteria bacterium M_surface_7_m2_040]
MPKKCLRGRNGRDGDQRSAPPDGLLVGLIGPWAVSLVSCGYRNSSDRMVIARCLGPDQFFLERVVFPFELLSFQCPEQSELEIWTHGLGGAELVETIPASELLIETAAVPALMEPRRSDSTQAALAS